MLTVISYSTKIIVFNSVRILLLFYWRCVSFLFPSFFVVFVGFVYSAGKIKMEGKGRITDDRTFF